MKRVEYAAHPDFRKNERDELFLRKLNGILAPHERASYRELPERFPTLHVIGGARTGTTLLLQLLATHLGIGFIDHLIAAFYQAPCFGIRLSKKLIRGRPASSYESAYGQTKSVFEPHEFGYFWSELLSYADLVEPEDPSQAGVDWERVRLVLTNMCDAFSSPIVFKSFMLGFYIREVQQVLPKTCFVLITRDHVATALSILRLRRRYGGDAKRRIGLAPREYAFLADRTVYEQAAGQAIFAEKTMRRAITRASGRNVIEVSYRELCASPATVLAKCHDLLARCGADLPEPPKNVPPFNQRSSGGDAKERSLVAEAVRALEEGGPEGLPRLGS